MSSFQLKCSIIVVVTIALICLSVVFLVIVKDISKANAIERSIALAFEEGYEAGLGADGEKAEEAFQSTELHSEWQRGFAKGKGEREAARKKKNIEKAKRRAKALQEQKVLKHLGDTYTGAVKILADSEFSFRHQDARELEEYFHENRDEILENPTGLVAKFGFAWEIKIKHDTAAAEYRRVLRPWLNDQGITSATEWYTLQEVINRSYDLDYETEIKPFKSKFGLSDSVFSR